MPLREDIAGEPDPKVRSRLKAEHLRDLWAAEWPVNGNPTIARTVNGQNWAIVFQQRPTIIRDKDGNIVGIDAMVRVFRNGVELHVDGHRICINPPILVPDGLGGYELNPREAFLTWLVDSLRDTPNASGWRP